MALETGTYINSLNASNPTATDALSQADDHMRLIKSTIKATFPNVSGAITSSHTELNLLDGLATTDILMPSGSVIIYGGTSAPTGWLLCDGSAISRSTYAALFSAIATAYGVGDGSSTFNIPDIRGRVVAGKEASASLLTSAIGGLNGNALGNTGGVQGVTLTSAQSGVPAHNHSLTMNSHTHTFTGGSHSHSFVYGLDNFHDISGSTPSGNFGSGQSKATSSEQVTGSNATVTTTGSIANNSTANASSAHSNTQPTIILNYIIKT